MTPAEALVDVTARLSRLGVSHALVGGLAVSIRGRSGSLATSISRFTLRRSWNRTTGIARLRSSSGVVVDLLAASSGIEHEIVEAAQETEEMPGVRVALAEHLLAMNVLSMRDARLQDRMDAR